MGSPTATPRALEPHAKGRVWSYEEARDIHDWVRWVRQVGPAITDDSVSLEIGDVGVLLPEPATERPPYVPLSIEWPYQLIATLSERRKVAYRGEAYALHETDLRITSHSAEGPLRFAVATPSWDLEFEYEFQRGRAASDPNRPVTTAR